MLPTRVRQPKTEPITISTARILGTLRRCSQKTAGPVMVAMNSEIRKGVMMLPAARTPASTITREPPTTRMEANLVRRLSEAADWDLLSCVLSGMGKPLRSA